MNGGLMGQRVRTARIAAGLTQVKLASLAECDPTTISLIERGEVDTSVSLITRIARVLGVSTDSLLLGT